MKQIMIGGMVESSAAALGCMRICRVPLEDAKKVVHQALDLGIRLFVNLQLIPTLYESVQ